MNIQSLVLAALFSALFTTSTLASEDRFKHSDNGYCGILCRLGETLDGDDEDDGGEDDDDERSEGKHRRDK